MATPTPDCNEIAWGVYQVCLYAHMQYLSEPLRHGEEHCVSPTHVHIPPHIEAGLDMAIRAFKPGEPSMREGNTMFGDAELVFDAEFFKFEPRQ